MGDLLVLWDSREGRGRETASIYRLQNGNNDARQ